MAAKINFKSARRSLIFGVSLVSLIIGIGLSSFLTLVLLQVFSSSKSNYSVAQNIVEMNDAMSFIVSIMSDTISYAGYRTPPTGNDLFLPMSTAFPGNPNVANSRAGMYVMPFTSQGGKDGFTIAYQGNNDGSVKDCHGTTVGGDTEVAYLTFQQVPGAGRNNSMLCQRYNANKSTEVISKVLDQFWIRYGIDSTNTGEIDRYLTAAQIAATPELNQNYLKVRSIQLAVLLHSPTEVFAKNTPYSFSLWGQVNTKNDKYMYKFMTFTFPLSYLPDPKSIAEQGGIILTDSPAAIAALPFSPYTLPSNYFNNTKAFNDYSFTHDGSSSTASATTAFIAPFVEVSSMNSGKEIYVEYTVNDIGDGNDTYFCYFFRGINNNSVGDSNDYKFCFRNNKSQSTWYRYACSSPSSINVLNGDDGRLSNGDTIGMSIKFPTTVSSGQNFISKIYKNSTKILEYSSNGSPCQGKWDNAINNTEKVVFTVGNFWGNTGMKQITISKPPMYTPSGAVILN